MRFQAWISILGLAASGALACAQSPDAAVIPDADQLREQMEMAKEAARSAADSLKSGDGFKFEFNNDVRADVRAQLDDSLRHWNVSNGRGGEDSLYQNGQRALDERRYDQALADFREVASRAGTRADGALYWQAYALNKLARRDEANTAIATLRKTYPNSRWLEDAKALEVEVKQGTGSAVSPEGENDDEIKLLALNGLVESDPDRALPLLEKLLKSAQSPRLKERVLFVLAESSAPRATEMLNQIARGSANPDLQLKAINYLAEVNRKQAAGSQVLVDIYGGASDTRVKRAVINALYERHDAKSMVDVGHKERDPELRKDIVRHLADMKSPEATQFLEDILK